MTGAYTQSLPENFAVGANGFQSTKHRYFATMTKYLVTKVYGTASGFSDIFEIGRSCLRRT
jgi:hypothetical protein